MEFEGGFTFDSQGGSQKSATAGNVIPVTLKQLVDAFTNSPPAGALQIDSVTTQHVALCAKIVALDIKPTFFMLTLDDGTGSADVRMFRKGTEDDESKELTVKEGEYITCVAALKSFNNKWQVNTSNVSAVTDFNHVIFHQMQSLQTHLRATGVKPNGGADGVKGESKTGADLFVSDNSNDALLEVVRELTVMCPDGVPTEQIASVSNIPVNKLRDKLQELITEGRVMECMDNHYMCIA
ncbi:Replication protein A 32 kDa subunit B [Yarrowia sp. C11]|nr:Replication protein A 32 kDa subunit B [Yarrowia sp. C11]KAG5364911.1 Replication protein A 32 kDa subunit B [Yarrowia sp. E02]